MLLDISAPPPKKKSLDMQRHALHTKPVLDDHQRHVVLLRTTERQLRDGQTCRNQGQRVRGVTRKRFRSSENHGAARIRLRLRHLDVPTIYRAHLPWPLHDGLRDERRFVLLRLRMVSEGVFWVTHFFGSYHKNIRINF